ncbi:MAG: oxidoreductase [Clostridiales Family XIII bacterium]|jgi:Fe-S-cluster-containing dehydrogenase component|nr:oxidoreductase [Clostridiales Family XIII bacterium]
METLRMIVDIAKCVGCFNCLMACKDEHVGNAWLPYTDGQQKHAQKWIEPTRHERGRAPYTDLCYVTRLCRHCDDAPCEKAFPAAVRKRSDGVVLLDAEAARGNRELPAACPYGMISWNEALQTAQKCTLCAHLLDAGWREPRCVQACPLRALSIVKCEDAAFAEIAENQGLRALDDGPGKPRVLYKNLHRYTSLFIAGALTFMDGGIEKAAAGAKVRLSAGGVPLAEADADIFGEFKFDGIPRDTGAFRIDCALDGFKDLRAELSVGGESVCMEPLRFERA